MKPELVCDRYKILERLGTGESCAVHKVQDLSSGEMLALKILLDGDGEKSRSLEREFLRLQEIDHPFYPTAFDFGIESDGRPFFTMEYAEGLDLAAFVQKEKALTGLPGLVISICFALRCLHNRGMVHGDLKPQNMRVKEAAAEGSLPEVKILDLGLSRPFYRGEGREFSGTVSYLAPEIVLGEDIDNRSDIYSLGISLYEALTGRLPHTGAKMDVVKQVISGDIPPIGGVRGDIPGFLAELIDSMVSSRPADRPARVEKIITALQENGVWSDSCQGKPVFASPALLRSEDISNKLAGLGCKEVEDTGIRMRLIGGAEGSGKSSLMRRLKSEKQVKGVTTCWIAGDLQEEPFAAFKRLARTIDPAGYCTESGEDILDRLDYEGVRVVVKDLVDKMNGRRVAFFIDDAEVLDGASLISLKLLLLSLSWASPDCFIALEKGLKSVDEDTSLSGEGLKAFLAGLEISIADREALKLTRLSHDQVEELVRGCLGDVGRGLDDLIDDLEKLTAGNPGLIKRFLHLLSAEGVLRFSGGTWSVDTGALKELEIPEEVDSLLMAKTSSLDEEEVEILCAASVLGEDFSTGDLVALVGDRNLDRRKAMKRLMKPGDYLLDSGEGRLRFNGSVLREHFYGRLEGEERKALHRRALGIILSGGHDESQSCIARHYYGSGELEKGIPYLKAAVAEEKTKGRPYEALKRLETLREWTRDDREEEFSIARETGDILFDLRSFPAAEEEYRKAIAAEQVGGGPLESRLAVQVQLARSLIRVSELDEAHDLLMETGERMAWSKDVALTGKVQRELGWIHFQRGQFKSALRYYKKSLEVSRRNDDTLNLLHLYNDIAVLYQRTNVWKKADWWVRKGLKEGEKHANLEVVANAWTIHGQGWRKRGDYRMAERSYLKALNIFRESRDNFGLGLIYNDIGELYREKGELERAIEYHEKSLYLKEFLHNHIGVAYSLSNLGLTYRAMGRLDEAREFFSRGIDIRVRVGDISNAARVYGYLAETLIEQERWNEARDIMASRRDLVEESESERGRQYSGYLEGLIELRMGSYDKAADKLTDSVKGYETLALREDAIKARKDLSWSLLGLGRREEAEKEALKALRQARLSGNQTLIIECHLALARALEEGGRENEACEQYHTARKRLDEAPFKPLRARVLLSCAEHLFRRGAWKRRGNEASEFDNSLAEAEGLFREMGVEGKVSAIKSLRERVAMGMEEIGGRELFTLYEAGRIINSSLEIDIVLNRMMDLIIETMDVERGVIFVKDLVTEELAMEVARNVEKETIEDAMSFSSTILNDVEKKGKPVFISDCSQDELCSKSISVSRYSILSVICVPLRLKGEIIGTVYVDDRRTNHLFHEGDVDFLMSLGDLAAMAIQNARLYRELDISNRRLKEENRDLRRRARVRSEFHGMVGRHEKMLVLYQVIEKVGQTDAAVMIRGENGSGKELVARAIHYLSRRSEGPFIVINCAAIPEALLESEIFGIEKGTATGVDRRVGKFEQADGGTLFMDEIGDMSPAIQAKLLRVLQEKRFQRLGGKSSIVVDVKILSATNKDLEEAIQAGAFREDLYYRLNALPVFVPSLRERVEDIPLLVESFLRKWSEENDRDLPKVGGGVMKILCDYAWPGNVRQLLNVIERMALLSSDGMLKMEDLPPEFLKQLGSGESEIEGEFRNLRDMQRAYVIRTFQKCQKNKRKTCEILGITYKTLQSYLTR